MKNHNYKNILYGCAYYLISLIFINHLLIILFNVFHVNALSIVFPASILISLFTLLYIFKKSSCSNIDLVFTFILSICIFSISFIISSLFFDFSWDGLWYHQAAIYFLKEGWNPVLDPVRTFSNCEANSVLHFAKGPWYFAASVYSAFQNFEASKCINIVVFFALFFIIYSTSKTYELSGFKSLILATLVVLNPVIINEMLTFLVDQLLISFLIIYVVSIIRWLRKKELTDILISIMAAILLINTKFTGLIFYITTSFFTLIFIIFYARDVIKKFIIHQVIILVFGVFIFGYNPYVTNTLKFGHPFYPVMGSDTQTDSNEAYETPKNMVGKNTLTRFFYATFSKPGNSPFNNEENAVLMWPFTSNPSGWDIYRFHEARISGFGPYFSGILILSFILSLFIIIKQKRIRWILIIACSSILFSMLLNKHFWIPRFAPQFWYLPIIPVVISWVYPQTKRLLNYTYFIVILIVINSSIVVCSHLKWEINSTKLLKEQLTEIKEMNKPIVVHCRWFKKATEEKLNKWNIDFEFVRFNELSEKKNIELHTVVEGYPGTITYNIKNND